MLYMVYMYTNYMLYMVGGVMGRARARARVSEREGESRREREREGEREREVGWESWSERGGCVRVRG